MSGGATLPVEVFADPTCPWCYIGWRSLAAAGALRPKVKLQRLWRPFLLNPRMPKGGMDRAAYYQRKFGDLEQLAPSRRTLLHMAQALGAPLDLDAAKILPNTIDAHRVILWAYGQERGEAMVDALCAAFWIEGRDIGRADVLGAIASQAGLDGALVEQLLAGDADADRVLAHHEAAVRGGISGVPVMIFARQAAVQGALAPDQFARAIDAVTGA